jgi:hypothetical protein
MLHRRLDTALRDLRKEYSLDVRILLRDFLCKVIGDRLTFTVRVRRDKDLFAFRGERLQFVDDLFLTFDRRILCFKAVLDIDAELRLR